HYVLNLSEGIEEPGGIKWDLLSFLFTLQLDCCDCLSLTRDKNIWKGCVFCSYISILRPHNSTYHWSLTRGSHQWNLYFISPNWKKLLDIKARYKKSKYFIIHIGA
ncbi:hypothetical protein CEXT_722071, partial [Caerostris extrusa]